MAGAAVGLVGGLIGLGGAEFRLPLLIGLFGFAALEAVILNKATSLIVVATALPFRAGTVPLDQVLAEWPIILNLLAGSLLGAWIGAGLAVRMKSRTLYRVLAGLLVLIAAVLVLSHSTTRPFNYLGCIDCRGRLCSLPVLAEERRDALEDQY